MRIVSVYKGGDGSGHKGHKGRVGKRGGSLPGTSSPSVAVRLENMPTQMTTELDTMYKAFGVSDAIGLTRKIESMFNYEMKSADMHSSVVKIWFSKHGDIVVSGQIYGVPSWGTDKTRVSIGTFERTFMLGDDGEMVVSHDSLTISPGWRKKGFGSSFFQFSEDAYIKQGFDKIVTFAGDDVGGYAWARLGFDWNEDFWTDVKGFSVEDCKAEIMRTLAKNWTARYKDLPLPSGLNHPWEIAMLTGPDGFDIGHKTLAGSQWPGVKSLKAGSVGLDIGDAYYYAKRKALRDESKN